MCTMRYDSLRVDLTSLSNNIKSSALHRQASTYCDVSVRLWRQKTTGISPAGGVFSFLCVLIVYF
jgi:hypothetical protein